MIPNSWVTRVFLHGCGLDAHNLRVFVMFPSRSELDYVKAAVGTRFHRIAADAVEHDFAELAID